VTGTMTDDTTETVTNPPADYKGIILAGGTGTRLHPITLGVSKQLLPIYDKPMIYYSLSVLMLANIKKILIISTEKDLPAFKSILGDGSQFGIQLQYAVQHQPRGIADAFIVAEQFIAEDNCCLVLGDNVFYGQDFQSKLAKATSKKTGATIFCYHVNDPSRYGVLELNKNGTLVGLEEKPIKPKSNWAVTGLYFFDNRVIEMAKSLLPSKRGELEVTDLIVQYLDLHELDAQTLGRGFAWLDTGTHESLLDAGQFVQTIEKRQGLKIACLEEIAYMKGWINESVLNKQIEFYKNTGYGAYLQQLKTSESIYLKG